MGVLCRHNNRRVSEIHTARTCRSIPHITMVYACGSLLPVVYATEAHNEKVTWELKRHWGRR